MQRLIGAHMTTAGGLHRAIINGRAIGCTAIQVFTSNPQQWRSKKITVEMARAFEQAKKQTGIRFVIAHDCYLINLAAPNTQIRHKSIEALVEELVRCEKLKIPWVVCHLGSHLGEGEDAGLKLLADGIKNVLAEGPKTVGIALETTAGQGSNLGYRFEHLRSVLDANHGTKRLSVCLDTCHIFAAGYDIRGDVAYEATLADFDRIIGLKRLIAIHANDSKHPLGSRRDRHEHIGKGFIGPRAFKRIVNDPRLAHAPILIETPNADTMNVTNIKRLRSYLRSKP